MSDTPAHAPEVLQKLPQLLQLHPDWSLTQLVEEAVRTLEEVEVPDSQKAAPEPSQQAAPEAPPAPPTAPQAVKVTDSLPMIAGASGPAVAAVQAAMKTAGLETGQPGIFGRTERASVRRFQAAHGLTSSGELDAATFAAIAAE